MKDVNGKSRGFGFVNFEMSDAAAAAVEKFNGTTLFDKVLYVGKAQKKSEREAELRAKYEQERNGRLEKLQGLSLYLKNLDDSINDEKLSELFSPFGTAHFARLNSPGALAPAMPTMPGYQPVPSRLAPQQFYFGQGVSSLIPSQPAGYGYQQQLIPGIRPGVVPNYMMPYSPQRQGQLGQRTGSRRGGTPQLMQQQQMLGEQLYPLVEQIEREQAGKVTGMLLEMDQTEVLHLIESPDALKKKVAEAMEVLRLAHATPNALDQID
ncbi:hypothetical protein BHE74_00003954 [Ensete ventricosum]|uniref:Uncharacterized protein n=1 Tax=Ensete ventricosum TaxID=4639 RepID=A0A427ALY5_ENSVE|nr:hypothetical protein B296_00010998 [Ensete ventricosum]RWW31255.1 hypothetical protein GW17_00004117 [Ensete ventricosum]RWW87234.1 hypothetical protein BHE74_00003954 [Ensete ventricosum]RZR85173.1 hypothetical protein BHM03_00012131 [Ensete ventricosum]